MAEKLDPKETISILELTVSHMWSIAALVEVLERKGLFTKQEVRDVITELRGQTPKAEQASPPLEAIPEPYLMRDTEDRVQRRCPHVAARDQRGMSSHTYGMGPRCRTA